MATFWVPLGFRKTLLAFWHAIDEQSFFLIVAPKAQHALSIKTSLLKTDESLSFVSSQFRESRKTKTIYRHGRPAQAKRLIGHVFKAVLSLKGRRQVPQLFGWDRGMLAL